MLIQLKLNGDNCSKILDAGCGMGDFTKELAGSFIDSQITGIDISEEMIKLCNATKIREHIQNIDFKVSNLLNTKFVDNEFDASTSLNTCSAWMCHPHQRFSKQ